MRHVLHDAGIFLFAAAMLIGVAAVLGTVDLLFLAFRRLRRKPEKSYLGDIYGRH